MNTFTKLQHAVFCGLMTFGFASSGFSQQNANDQSPFDPGNGVSNHQGQYTFNGINQNPWFNNPAIRQEMNWNDNQFQQLNQNYGTIWDQYSQNLRNTYQGLSDEQRMQRQQDLYGKFNNDFSQSMSGVFNDPAAADRYNQLYLQYRGYGAFSDPAVQQELRLTPAQRQRFNQYDREWNRSMNRWSREYGNNPDTVGTQFENAQRQYQRNLRQNLTPQQQEVWGNLSGKPYNFTPNMYFQNGPSAGNTNNANPPAATSSNSATGGAPTNGGAPAGNPK